MLKIERKIAPGRSERQGISLLQLAKMFPTEEAATEWLEKERWPEDRPCPHCGNVDTMETRNRKPMPFRCRGCRRYFSVRTGTVMERSHIPLKKWVWGVYLWTTSLKGVAAMKLHRDLEISYPSAWFMVHRLREAFADGDGIFNGPIEVDEVYLGGKRKNMPKRKRAKLEGRGSVGKTTVTGAKDRETRNVAARVVPNTRSETLCRFVMEHSEDGAKVYTDDSSAYVRLDNHETVKHSIMEYVRGEIHTNGIESFWSLLKRAYIGTFHHFSAKHCHRYLYEFVGRNNVRDLDTIDQMRTVVARMIGRRLTYKELVS